MRAVILLVAFTLLLPFASADEAISDCEADQPWIGYRSTDPVRAIVAPLAAGSGALVEACEGEQWDGQDGIEGGTTFGYGLGEDPNAGPVGSPFDPFGVRVTSRGTSEVYVALRVEFVGRFAVYGGTCGAGETGLEGAASCEGTRALRSGVYARDGTPGNVLATIVTCGFRVTGCYVEESDCSQAVYQQGQYVPPSPCRRDNTAFGVGLVLA